MRPRIPLLIALLLITAGCLGGSSPPAGTETSATPTTTPTRTPTAETPETDTATPETTRYATDCPPYLSVELAGDEQVEDADRVLAFEDLPADRQQEFERALDGDTALESGTVDFWVGTVVTYRDEYYATGVYVC